MGPFERLDYAMFKLDDIRMRANSLMVEKKVLNIRSVKKKMVKAPIHHKLVCGARLKISLREA